MPNNSFTVVSRATTGSGNTQKFNVTTNRNVQITNYQVNKEKPEAGDFNARFYNGRNNISIYNSENKEETNKATLDLSTNRYAAFKELVGLDGDSSTLSEKDLQSASKLVGKHGITNIRKDSNAGVTTLVFNDGAILRFDFETEAEKAVREKNERIEQQRQDSINQAKREKEEQFQKELNERCKSDFEKFIEWLF